MMSDNLQKYRWLSRFLPKKTSKRIVTLTGARQTGKTTLVKKVYPELNYINLDAIENREAVRGVASARWDKDIGVAIFDEAQKEPSIFEKIKYAYDAGRLPFSVLLGSAQILLLGKIRETLAGRVFLFELWPLMLSELLTPESGPLPEAPLIEKVLAASSFDKVLDACPAFLLEEEEVKRKKAESYLLKWGGMPELLRLNDEEKREWLKSYEYTYLERDLSDLARLSDLDPFRKFQRLAALRSGRLLNYSELAKDAGISVDSARRYLEYLRLSYQTILLQPFYENLTSSVIKTPKVYTLDVGLLRQAIGFTGEASGEIYETYVVSEVFKWIKTNQKDAEMYFYRTRSGLELDLLIRTERGFIGIEVKSGQRISRSDYRPMVAVADKLKRKWLGGMCVFPGKKIEKLADPNIWAVPSHRLFSS